MAVVDSRPMMRTTLLVAIVCGVGVAGAAPRLAPLRPQIQPPASPEIVTRLHDALEDAVGKLEHAQVSPGATVRTAMAHLPPHGCLDTACYHQAAVTLGATHFVEARLDVVGKAYVVRAVLLDAEGREVAAAIERCEICTMAEVATIHKNCRKMAVPCLVN